MIRFVLARASVKLDSPAKVHANALLCAKMKLKLFMYLPLFFAMLASMCMMMSNMTDPIERGRGLDRSL